MQTSVWTALLRRIPLELHDSLAIVTTAGIDINVQDLLRIQEDHLVVRGRLAGTTDLGRIFFIPCSQIHYLGFQKEVRVAQVMALYGEVTAAEQALLPSEGSTVADPSMEPAATAAPPDVPSLPSADVNLLPEPPKPGVQLSIPRKSRLLERLRARSQTGTNTRPPTNP
jgi:hypothetical protein